MTSVAERRSAPLYQLPRASTSVPALTVTVPLRLFQLLMVIVPEPPITFPDDWFTAARHGATP